MFKDMYQHHYDKATVPEYVTLIDLIGYIGDEDYDSLKSLDFRGVDVTLTVRREPEDKEACLPVSYELDSIDVAWAPTECVLFRESICRAVEDYIYSNEDSFLYSDRVAEAFHWMDEARKR